MDDADHSGPNGRGDEVTGRMRAINAVEYRQSELDMKLLKAEKHAKRLKFWVQIIGGVSVGVFLAGAWAARTWAGVAHTQQLDAVRDRVGAVEAGMVVIGVKVDALGADGRWSRDQLLEIARTVRAPMVVQPSPPPAAIAVPERK